MSDWQWFQFLLGLAIHIAPFVLAVVLHRRMLAHMHREFEYVENSLRWRYADTCCRDAQHKREIGHVDRKVTVLYKKFAVPTQTKKRDTSHE